MGIRPNNWHFRTIQEYRVPTDLDEVKRCLGLFKFFRRFVPDFSRIARPLTDLKKNKIFMWTSEYEKAFQILKNRLINDPELMIYSPLRDTELQTDASVMGFGSVLMQRQEGNKFHSVAYYSKCTSSANHRYHSLELETLSLSGIFGRNFV